MALKGLKFPRLVYNYISAVGIAISLVTILLITFLYVVGIFASETNPYLGIFLYMVLPPILIFGMLLVPIGMLKRWLKMKKTGEEDYPSWPYINLNKSSHRNATLVFLLGTILFLMIGAVGGYEAYHFSESITFCGKICHRVMKPEHVAYQNSPHARVPCVSCHVGPGADWFAKAKLAGAYQVYAVLADKYPRPIPTPIKNLRPARETCEQCHWPERFFGGQQKVFEHYMYDEENTHWPINMLIKVGGGNPETGLTSGIHWHTFINNQIEYIARDDRHQDIPWVKSTNLKTGRETIYQNTEAPLTQEEIDSAEVRLVDCMDCHNRPSHIYYSPDHAIDEAIFTNRIDKSLPYIKRLSVEAMAIEYDNEEAAWHGIANHISDFYAGEYPELYEERQEDINQAIAATQEKYSQNIFPEMKVRWEEYPNNIGHFIDPGCMRCHEGLHASDDGKVITKECKSCHSILSQGGGDRFELAKTVEGLEFVHPEDIDGTEREMGCYECHTGTQP